MEWYDTITIGDVYVLIAAALAIITLGMALWCIVQLRNRIRQLVRDRLTGLFNRMVFEEIYQRMFKIAYRLKFEVNGRRRQSDAVDNGLILLFFDIDHFKSVNDKYGHLVGDKTLRIFGQLLEHVSRTGDLVGRWGGEEFVVVLETNLTGALVFLKRFLNILKARDFPAGVIRKPFNITVTCGIATLDSDKQTPDDLLQKADEALLYGKRAEDGRDCCVFWKNGGLELRKHSEF